MTFLPLAAGWGCLLVAAICFVVFTFTSTQSVVDAGGNHQTPAGTVPYLAATMFSWFGLIGLGTQGYLTWSRLRRQSRLRAVTWFLLVSGLAPVAVSVIAVVASAGLPLALAPLAGATLAWTVLVAQLRDRWWLEGALVGLVPFAGPIIEAFLPGRPPESSGRPRPSR